MWMVSEAVPAYGSRPRTSAAVQRDSHGDEVARLRPTAQAWRGRIASPNRCVAIPAAIALIAWFWPKEIKRHPEPVIT